MSNVVYSGHLGPDGLNGAGGINHVRKPASQNGGHVNQKPHDPKLWDTCLKFEALFLQQMMSAMRKTVPESGLLPSGFANNVYDSMFDEVVAEAGSRRSSLGIASSLYRQLDQLYRTQAQPSATDTLHIDVSDQGDKHGED